jgi:hypothetical protein
VHQSLIVTVDQKPGDIQEIETQYVVIYIRHIEEMGKTTQLPKVNHNFFHAIDLAGRTVGGLKQTSVGFVALLGVP